MKTIKLFIITICVGMLCAYSSSVSAWTVDASGGNGATGGQGGYFFADSDGAIKVLKSGAADTGFTMPDKSSYNLGTNGYTVSGKEEILLDTAVPAHYAGLYVIGGGSDRNLYKADGTGTAGNPNLAYTVSGLRVPAGATLTINADNGFYSSQAGVSLDFAHDVIINGKLKTGEGYNYIYFWNASSYSNNIVVTGTVTTSGANEGWIEFFAGKNFYNSGTIDASGGDNATGSGYSSEGIEIYADTGSVYSKGTFRANGGKGHNGSGGSASSIYLVGGEEEGTDVDPVNGGSVIVRGTIEAKGGNGGGTAGGNGGSGGWSGFYAYGGDMIVHASFNISGGNAAGLGNTGGAPSGATFFITGENYRRVGVCQISGSFDVAGGQGATGGQGGYVEVDSWAYNYDTDNPINYLGQAPDVELFGLSHINVSGGDGKTQGGNAGYYELYTYASPNYLYFESMPAYPIISEANVEAKGGNATASGATGGLGGYVELATDYYGDNTTTDTTVTQSGTIDVSGGNATASGGTGGNAYDIFLGSGNNGDCWNVTTTGKLIANGGKGGTTGGNGGYINLYSNDISTVYKLANLSVTGGKGGTTAGSTGSAYVDGVQVLP
ncbi:MAG: hypothetical protein ABSC54_08470 [Smithellaceae bacterium]|jgi:hypothetical protein